MKIIKVIFALETAHLLTAEKGSAFLQLVKSELNSEDIVELDFAGYEFISSSFINRAFGDICLEKGWDVKDFYSKVKFTNIDKDDIDDIELAIFNAKHRRELMDSGKNLSDYYPPSYAY
ncbi:MAG: STAS-like domain-containing protein [Ignavibacteriaceae bacterium]|jgi:hypothetical protein